MEFTAYEVDDGDVPACEYPFTVRFWRRHNGHMAVRWALPPRTDSVVMAGAGTGRAQVRDLVAVAFYPVLLGRAQQLVYVMSVWRWDAGRNERSLVRSYFLYEGQYSMNNSVNRRTDSDPGQLSPLITEFRVRRIVSDSRRPRSIEAWTKTRGLASAGPPRIMPTAMWWHW